MKTSREDIRSVKSLKLCTKYSKLPIKISLLLFTICKQFFKNSQTKRCKKIFVIGFSSF